MSRLRLSRSWVRSHDGLVKWWATVSRGRQDQFITLSLLNTDGTTQGMPRGHIVLRTIPPAQLVLQGKLVFFPSITRCGVAMSPTLVFPQSGIGCGWRERRIIVKGRERSEIDIQRSFYILLMTRGESRKCRSRASSLPKDLSQSLHSKDEYAGESRRC